MLVRGKVASHWCFRDSEWGGKEFLGARRGGAGAGTGDKLWAVGQFRIGLLVILTNFLLVYSYAPKGSASYSSIFEETAPRVGSGSLLAPSLAGWCEAVVPLSQTCHSLAPLAV